MQLEQLLAAYFILVSCLIYSSTEDENDIFTRNVGCL
jgi:hypothetical protein